jgi:hypothetical protein
MPSYHKKYYPVKYKKVRSGRDKSEQNPTLMGSIPIERDDYMVAWLSG